MVMYMVVKCCYDRSRHNILTKTCQFKPCRTCIGTSCIIYHKMYYRVRFYQNHTPIYHGLRPNQIIIYFLIFFFSNGSRFQHSFRHTKSLRNYGCDMVYHMFAILSVKTRKKRNEFRLSSRKEFHEFYYKPRRSFSKKPLFYGFLLR